jgi:heme-degrading monooxygenase HmoA
MGEQPRRLGAASLCVRLKERPTIGSTVIHIDEIGGPVIARIWRGWAASASAADDYQRHYENQVTRHLREIPGFADARLLRLEDGDEVMFTSITFFSGLDAIRAFAGKNYEQAVVEDAARQALTRWDQQVAHHDVAVEVS